MRKIADKTELSATWSEFLPVPPLEATDKIFTVGLEIRNVKNRTGTDDTALEFTDGTIVKIEIELIDDTGRKTMLYLNGIGELVEFGKRAQNKENIEESYFQKGEKFKQIRLRSDKPVTTDKIVWAKFEF